MKYPVLIHKDADSEFGLTIPDIPGCFTSGKSISEALQNLQEAVICYYDGENTNVPPDASKIEDVINRQDIDAEGGFWLLADIDFSFLSKKSIRVNITIPEYKLAMIDRGAAKRGLTRSAFLVQAAESML
ncbi:MAG: type II toxin-antitoxin system HicB family antitoxin [Desulfamplus sp.]|nr:type II toxin-antitoxin system HicB family antitoxin [Desulfamplus sp.]